MSDDDEAVEALKDAQHKDHVAIFIDGVEHKVRGGEWIVRNLKAHLGIDPAKVLAHITAHGLKDLHDDAEIHVHEGERFMTHARSGGSS